MGDKISALKNVKNYTEGSRDRKMENMKKELRDMMIRMTHARTNWRSIRRK